MSEPEETLLPRDEGVHADVEVSKRWRATWEALLQGVELDILRMEGVLDSITYGKVLQLVDAVLTVAEFDDEVPEEVGLSLGGMLRHRLRPCGESV